MAPLKKLKQKKKFAKPFENCRSSLPLNFIDKQQNAYGKRLQVNETWISKAVALTIILHLNIFSPSRTTHVGTALDYSRNRCSRSVDVKARSQTDETFDQSIMIIRVS